MNARRQGSPHTAELPESVRCPFCGSERSKPLATFGSLLMTSQYYCEDCRTTFEWVRWEDGRASRDARR